MVAKSLNIIFIGAGNLATHLANAIARAGHNISQVYSRTESSARALADRFDAQYTTEVNQIKATGDIYFVTVTDKILEPLIRKSFLRNRFFVHCSGTLPLDILRFYTSDYGVFYPVQTFSKNRNVNFESIPICVEANNKDNLEMLSELANQISTEVQVINSEKRKYIHLAAVFANNFTNHLYTISQDILDKKGISLDILKPLIRETAEKALMMNPQTAQTGPAKRNDENITSQHIELLNDKQLYLRIYRLMSESIRQTSGE